MKQHTIFLSFGSNLGKPKDQIEQGIVSLEEQGVTILERSKWYETEPEHVSDQPWFLNAVARASTTLEPLDLLALCQRVEKQVGRVPSVRFGPRHLDIDILLYDDLCMESDELTLPHPRMNVRQFVLIPLLEIAPDLQDPRLNQSYAEHLNRLDEGKKVLRSLINEF
jgi:2-amino-4-hydroxy-6-hydroxymethyldihydropteridine diphosphokinase